MINCFLNRIFNYCAWLYIHEAVIWILINVKVEKKRKKNGVLVHIHETIFDSKFALDEDGNRAVSGLPHF